jgi:hypothetical protein
MADDKIALSIEIEADRAQMSLGELEKGFDGLKEKLKAQERVTDEGKAAFNRLATQMAQTSGEIKNMELAFEGLDKEQIASELGSVAGGIGDITASLVLMGGENETIEQMGASIEKAMAISMGLKGAIEGLSSANKLYNNLLKQGKVAIIAKSVAEKAAAAGTWLMTAAQTAFNVVMSMNPIALVVIAIAALVAGFILLGSNIKKVIDFALLPLTLVIDGVKAALRSLGLMESESAEQTKKAEEEKAAAVKKASEDKIKEYQKQITELQKLQDAHKRLSEEVIGDMEFEVAMLKAKGENSVKAEWDLLKQKKKLANEAHKLIYAELQDIKQVAVERRKLGENFTKEEADRYEALKILNEEAAEVTKKADQEIELYRAAHNKGVQDKRDKEAKEASDRRKAQREKDNNQLIEEAKALAEFNEEQARIKIQLIQDEGERKRAEIEYSAQLELEALEKKGALTFDAEMLIAQTKNKALADLEKTEEDKRFALEKEAQVKRDEYDKLLFDAKIANEQEETEKKKLQLEEDYQNNITRLEEEGLLTMELEFELLYTKEQALADIEKEFRDKAAAEKQAQRDKDFALASASIAALSALNKAATDTALLNAAGDEEKKEKIRKASFEREKKLNIAMALINGAQAVLAGFAQGGLPMAIVAGVTAAAQLAAIVATTYQGGGSVKEVDKTAPVEPSGAGAGGAGAQINAVTNTSTILGNQQVYVTETDITTTQNNVSVIEESATF